MPAVARKDKKDSVSSPHGSGSNCESPNVYHTDAGSSNVFANNIGVVREGDTMEVHPNSGCAPHAPGLSTYSSNVYVNNKRIGRKGDEYSSHYIITGSGDVFANS